MGAWMHDYFLPNQFPKCTKIFRHPQKIVYFLSAHLKHRLWNAYVRINLNDYNVIKENLFMNKLFWSTRPENVEHNKIFY